MSQNANIVLLASLIEAIFCSIEFITANTVFLQLSLYLFSETLPILIWHALIPTILSLLYFLLRYRRLLTLVDFPKWFGLFSFSNLSKVTFFAILFYIVEIGVAVLYQQTTNNWIFTLNNISARGAIDWNVLISVCFLTPLMEELIFRGIIYYLIASRMKNSFIALKYSNIIFGLFHLANAGVSKFHVIYIIMQVIFTPFIGYVLGARFVATKTLWESIILHCLNNLSAILVPPSPSSYSHPVVISASAATMVFYLCIYYHSMPKFTRANKKVD